MKTSRIAPRSIKTMPGIARIGRHLVAAFALFIFLPDSSSTGPIAPVEQFLPGLIGLTLLGLLIAWRRKLLGGIFVIVIMFIREAAWAMLKDNWEADPPSFCFFFLPPAIMYIIAWRQEKIKEDVVLCQLADILTAKTLRQLPCL